jgi:peptide/nickel transport system permease protein
MTTSSPSPVPHGFADFLSRAFASRSFVLGLAITAAIALMALISFFWTPYDVTKLVVQDRMLPPSWTHPFGTDQFGRDVLSMIMVGARNSIAVALVAVGIGMGIGVPIGCLAAARGGWLDEAVMRFNDVVFAFPALLSAIMITAVFGPGALAIWPREFILAARAAGKGKASITIEHILPNIATMLLVQGTIQFALGVLAEAGLSYVGLGAQPPMPSWGRMLFDAQTRMMVMPTLAIFPGLAIVITVLGLNLLGDGASDALDPKLAGRR